MESVEMFEFKISENNDKPAIWFRLLDEDVVIYPLALFCFLWDCSSRRWLGNKVEAEFYFLKDVVFGRFYDVLRGSYNIEYQREPFIQSAIQSLSDLCKFVNQGKESMYSGFTNVTAENLLIGLQNIVIPQNSTQIFFDEVCIEDFNFRFVESYNCDTKYEIKIGNRDYSSNLSDWTTDYNSIRNEIETFILSPCRETRMSL